MADDLRHFLAEHRRQDEVCDHGRAENRQRVAATAHSQYGADSAPISRPVKIVPKGLRSFDAADADFFLELLPGPRDRDGLPESIRFWKTRIEETDADRHLLGGPDLRAIGLRQVVAGESRSAAAIGEARLGGLCRGDGEETEARLAQGLAQAVPDLPANLGLVETLAALRRGQAS